METDYGSEPNINHKTRRVPTQPTGAPTAEDLAAAFSDDSQAAGKPDARQTKRKKPLTKLRKIAIAVVSVGAVILVVGVGCLAYNLLTASKSNDADFLVSVKSWQREDAPAVVWQFTEIGKGVLSTNGGENQYDFVWAFEDGKLKIDTDWLYTLDDEFDYQVDQNARTLTITSDEGTVTFIPTNSENAAQTKDAVDQDIDNTTEANVENAVDE